MALPNPRPLTSYAQNFEDVMLWRALKHIKDGCYIDVGAHSPNIDSVSRLFYENGWLGVHVEPVAKWAQELRLARPEETVVEAILGEESGKGVIYVLGDSGLNTTHIDIAQAHQRNAGLCFEATYVERLTLNDVFVLSGKAEFHWLKIDVEGDEDAVVRGWNKDRFRPWVVIVEATSPVGVARFDTQWEGELVASGYELVYEDGLNKFFISKERVETLRGFYQYPPNVFDNFAVSTGAGPWGREAADAVVRLREQLNKTSELELRIKADNKTAMELSAATQALIDNHATSRSRLRTEDSEGDASVALAGANRQKGQLGTGGLNDECKLESKAMMEFKNDARDVHTLLLKQMTELSRQNLTKEADRILLAHEDINIVRNSLAEQKKLVNVIADTINQLSSDQRALIRLLAHQTEKRDAFVNERAEMQRVHAIEFAIQRERVEKLERGLAEQTLANRELKEVKEEREVRQISLVDELEQLKHRHHQVLYNSAALQDSHNKLIDIEFRLREELRLTSEALNSANDLANRLSTENQLLSDLANRLSTENQLLSDLANRLSTENQHLRGRYSDLIADFNSLIVRKSWLLTRPLRRVMAAVAGRRFAEPQRVDPSVVGSNSSLALSVYAPPLMPNLLVKNTLDASIAPNPSEYQLAGQDTLDASITPNPSEYQLAISRAPVHRDWLKVNKVPPVVSIVILQYMKSDLTVNCVRSILKFTDPFRVEIVVVDNGSTDVHVETLIAEFDDLIKIVRVGTNRYFGEGNNIGVEACRGPLVAIMNNDIVVTKGWLEPLIYQLSTEGTGAVGPCFLYPDERIQECGGYVSADGAVEQRGKGAAFDSVGLGAYDCDYISAALLLMRREDYLKVGGFDLCYEPAYYEDVDLCFKLAAIGKRITCVPIVKVFHNENATSADPALGLNLSNIIAINSTKFYGRWGAWLKSERKIDAPSLNPKFPVGTIRAAGSPMRPEMKPRALIYTPYSLTPGGGEKYILTIAEHLLFSHAVTLVTLHSYSEIRIKQLAHALNLALEGLALSSYNGEILEQEWDIAFVLGNSISPPFSLKARKSFYICQFPFDFRSFVGQPIPRSETFEYICYSEFVRSNICKSSNIVPRRVKVMPPQVDSFGFNTVKTKSVLSVGRFFEGGHCKNQHLLIEAFERLVKRIEFRDWRLILAGSTRPEPEHRAYYQRCKSLASHLNVDFYPDVSHEELSALYAQAQVYWHGAGIGVEEEKTPEQLEHFGISPLEAVSAGCSVYVWRAGGPAENASAGVPNMSQFSSIDDLLEKMVDRSQVSESSQKEAARFIADHFGAQAFHLKLSALIEANIVEGKPTQATV
jgi:O-antigen biosynthesis protein